MQINRDNYSSYSKMIQQLLGGKNGTPDPYGTDYGNYSLRYTPTERPFTKPDWSNIATKQSSSTMSEKEFDLAIRELARKEFSSDNKDHKMIQGLMRKYQSVVAPDRKAIYENSMKKTGGKMNAACMFWNSRGDKSLAYHPITGRWSVFPTAEEQDRTRQFYSIYNDELKRLNAEYGEQSRGRISMDTIHKDLAITSSVGNGKLDIKI
ncbi:MAG: hypothetical protein E7510_12820 [Ruminococcus sp.]|nr:hypothetical protein [Ruminococcus sp.]MBP1565962.1 hypothetical protein [Oscillospiraceae bacterium]